MAFKWLSTCDNDWGRRNAYGLASDRSLAGITILTAGGHRVVTLILSDVAVPKQAVKSAQLVPTTALPRYFAPSCRAKS